VADDNVGISLVENVWLKEKKTLELPFCTVRWQ
jgi:hypothetical protein